MWQSLYLYKAIGTKLDDLLFLTDYAEEKEPSTRRCISFGEAVYVNKDDSTSGITHYFMAIGYRNLGFLRKAHDGFPTMV